MDSASRGSRRVFLALREPSEVQKTRDSPPRPSQTGVDCGVPSGMSVARCAKFGRSINFLASGDSALGIILSLITAGGARIQGSRLISDATYPAPNPLSISTTLTFD